MLGESIIQGFSVCKLFKFLKLNIYDEWCSFNVHHISARPQLWLRSGSPLLLSLPHTRLPRGPSGDTTRGGSCTPAVTRSSSRARSFCARASQRFGFKILSALSKAAAVKQWWSLFCAYQYNVNQRGLASSGLGNPRCLCAQTDSTVATDVTG